MAGGGPLRAPELRRVRTLPLVLILCDKNGGLYTTRISVNVCIYAYIYTHGGSSGLAQLFLYGPTGDSTRVA